MVNNLFFVGPHIHFHGRQNWPFSRVLGKEVSSFIPKDINITADDTSLGASQPSKASSQLKTIDLKTGDWSTFTFLWSYNNYGTTIIMVLS